MQLVEIRKRSDKYKKELINLMRFAMKKIEEGYLPELIQKREVFGYWYNSGFDSGHSRVIARNYGENYASERAQIRLTDSLYDEGKISVTPGDTRYISLSQTEVGRNRGAIMTATEVEKEIKERIANLRSSRKDSWMLALRKGRDIR